MLRAKIIAFAPLASSASGNYEAIPGFTAAPRRWNRSRCERMTSWREPIHPPSRSWLPERRGRFFNDFGEGTFHGRHACCDSALEALRCEIRSALPRQCHSLDGHGFVVGGQRIDESRHIGVAVVQEAGRV